MILNQVSPLIFNNSNLNSFKLGRFFNTFINRNSLRFQRFTNYSNFISKLDKITVYFYKNILDEDFLNKKIFMSTTFLNFFGVLDSIERNSFRDLKKIRKIILQLRHFVNIANKPLDWLSMINSDININDDNTSLDLFLQQNSSRVIFLGLELEDFIIKDEDFCTFKEFPHKQAVFMVTQYLGSDISLFDECSCTNLWLIKNAAIYERYFNLTYEEKYNYDFYLNEKIDEIPLFCNQTYQKLLGCDFESKLKKCFIKNQSFSILEKRLLNQLKIYMTIIMK